MVFTWKNLFPYRVAPRQGGDHRAALKALILGGVSALVLTACGGGGGGGSADGGGAPTGGNEAPTAVNDVFAVTTGTVDAPLSVLGNDLDSDLPADTLTIATFGTPSAGGTVQNTGSQLLYTPAAGFVGTETFSYSISDAAGATSSASVTIGVNSGGGVNLPPLITAIPDQVVDEDTSTDPLAFTIGDVETLAGSLVVTANSSSQTLIPDANLVLGGSDGSRTITVTPAPDLSGGPVTISVNVSDGSATSSMTFTVTVNARNDVPTITAIPDQTIDEDTSTGSLTFSIADIETAAGSLLVTATASNSTLIPDANLVLGGSGASRSITVTPAPDLNGGPVTITVNVTDGMATTPGTFTVTINALNDTPTVTAITDQTIVEDSIMGPLNFTIGDIETPADSLLVTLSSNNQALIPDVNLVLGGAGTDRTVQATPLLDQSGTAAITVTISDGADSTTTIFNVTVTALNDPPTAVDDGFTVNPGAANVPLDALGNDVDPDLPSDTLTIISTGTPSAGGTVNNTGSQLMYTPASGFSGTETFSYTIEDGAMVSSTATVTVVISSNGLIHYWKLDEASAPYSDTVGSASATCATCPASITGLIGTAQNIDGISDELSVVSTASVNWDSNQSFGMEFWVLKSTACVGDDAVVGRSDSQTQLNWWVGCDSAGSAVFELFDETGSGQRLTAVTNIADGQWHHVAAIRDAGTGQNRLYVDGALEASVNIGYATGFTSQSADLTIGWLDNPATDYHFGGIVDELAIHAGVMSDAAISQHFMDGFVGLRRGYLGCTGPVRTMPLGDSITRREGYRPQLYFDLVGADYDVDFVGSKADTTPSTHDPDNEGHSGFTTSDIAAQLNSWLLLNPPHVILLHIGTNEDPAFLYPSIAKVEDLLNIIDGFDPGITVVLARIINKAFSSYDPQISVFNQNLDTMAQARIAAGDKILVVDQEPVLDYSATTTDFAVGDDLHPTASGFAKMVPVWFNPLASFLPVCPP